MEGHTPLLFKESEIEMKHNYAQIDIARRGTRSIDIKVNVRTLNNQLLLSRRFFIGEAPLDYP